MGFILVCAYVILGAIQDVYLAWMFQYRNPTTVAFFTFSIGAIIFGFAAHKVQNQKNETKLSLFTPLFLLNLVTAINWISFFFALKYTEPTIVGAIAFALIPAFSTIILPIFRPAKKISKIEFISAFGVALGLAFLIYAALAQKSGLIKSATETAWVGILLSVVASIGMTFSTLISKNLSELGLKPITILSKRFFAIIMVTGIQLFIFEKGRLQLDHGFYLQLVCISLATIVIPQYLIQKGIQLLEPMKVGILLSFTPVITFAFEFFDSRLVFSQVTFTGVTICAIFSLLGLFKEAKI
jgi:drug/metabolite transporter (DMT)-like permease